MIRAQSKTISVKHHDWLVAVFEFLISMIQISGPQTLPTEEIFVNVMFFKKDLPCAEEY